MTSPYRSEDDALRERKTTLERELAEVKAQASALEDLRIREQELSRELAEVSQRLGGVSRRSLPVLERVSVASPCNASWDAMHGDERVRFCSSCQKNVYNLSAMTRQDAERLVQQREGNLCVRYFQRVDGTVLTADCPVGVKKKRRKKLVLAVAGASAVAAAATSAYASSVCAVQGEAVVMGAIAAPVMTEERPQSTSSDTAPDRHTREDDEEKPLTGEVRTDSAKAPDQPRKVEPGKDLTR